MSKKNIGNWTLVYLAIVVIGIIIVSIKVTMQRNKRETEYVELNLKADSLMSKMDNLLKSGEFDSSKNVMKQIMQQKTSFGEEPALRDSARKMILRIDKYLIWEKEERYKKVLTEITEIDYEKLLKNEFNKSYINYPYLNSLFIETLYKNKHKRQALLKEKRQRQEAKNASSRINKVIGKWMGNSVVTGIYTIIQKDGDFTLNVKNKDGSKGSYNLVVKKIKGKRCFFKQNNSFGEYFVLKNNRSLGVYDNEGLITTLKSY